VKIYVLDANALYGYLIGRSQAARVNDILNESSVKRVRAMMSAVNLGEVYHTFLRQMGETVANEAIASVHRLSLEITAADQRAALGAAKLKILHGLYYSDAFAADLALQTKGTLVTSDSDFQKIARKVKILWLKPN